MLRRNPGGPIGTIDLNLGRLCARLCFSVWLYVYTVVSKGSLLSVCRNCPLEIQLKSTDQTNYLHRVEEKDWLARLLSNQGINQGKQFQIETSSEPMS